MLKPASYITIKATRGVWEASQDFYRLGILIRVSGWGGTRAEAIKALNRAKFWADQPEPDPFKALYDILWTAAGALDSLIGVLGSIKARLRFK